MDIKHKKVGNDLYIYLYGEIDEYTSQKSRKIMDEIIDDNKFTSSITFNTSGVTFMDSTGIGMFLGRYKKIKKLNIPMYITGTNSVTDKIFEISGIYTIIPKK